MKLSESWLREWANPASTSGQLFDQLTMAGLEVKGCEPAGPLLSNVIVGEVMAVEPHPAADKLNLCQVHDGAETFTVVCGASNVHAGLKVAYARIGAILPGIKIKKAKLRGIESHGMLCSASELKLAEASTGILELPQDAPVGTQIIDYLQLDDQVIEFDLTPNRGDCLSVAGIAREIAALNDIALRGSEMNNIAHTISDEFGVELLAPEACSRYAGRIIRGINPAATTPMWMQEKLRRCGLRPISPVVDVTNFVMMELGQPMHGFDFDKLDGGIKVRMAEAGEKITLLDQSQFECRNDTLVIADHQKPIALAGIMGGLDTSVQAHTSNIFLEAAFFAPLAIAGIARSYGMHTDASHRFERGVDPMLPVRAIHRASELLLAIVGGSAGPVVDQVSLEHQPRSPDVHLRFDRIKRLLGIHVAREDIVRMLKGLDMELTQVLDGWMVIPPSYRFDINIEADLIEEIGRMYGYNNISGSEEVAHTRMDSFSETRIEVNQLKDVLVAMGFYEAITYSFVAPLLQSILDPGQPTLNLSNPISMDMSVMRTRLLPGLVQALQHNTNRQQSRVKLFETGLCFVPGSDGLKQRRHIAAVISGASNDEGIHAKNRPADFFDIKGALESLLNLSKIDNYRFSKSRNPILHPGQAADITCDGRVVGFSGCLHPEVTSRLDLVQPVYLFEIELDPLLAAALPEYQGLSRYPSIRRDISISVSEEIEVQDLIDCIYSIKNEILREVFVFDVYTGKEVRNSRKSVAFGLILQDFSRTLVEEDVEKLVNKILFQLKEHYNAVLREN